MAELKSIWVIDDDFVFTFLFRKIIEKVSGVGEVRYFSNGQEAIDFYRQGQGQFPEMILLDINMPVLDGWQFLDEYRKLTDSETKLPRIYMSSSSIDDTDRERALASGLVTDFISKPMNAEELQRLVDHILES